jgi:hypothetical protein
MKAREANKLIEDDGWFSGTNTWQSIGSSLFSIWIRAASALSFSTALAGNDVKCPDRLDWFVASLKKMQKSSL